MERSDRQLDSQYISCWTISCFFSNTNQIRIKMWLYWPGMSMHTRNMRKHKLWLRLMWLTTLTFSLGGGTRSKVGRPLMSAPNFNGNPSNSCWYFSVCFQSGRMACCPDAFTLCMCRLGECVRLNAHMHTPPPAQVLCARHFISPALQMDADGKRLFELHSLWLVVH